MGDGASAVSDHPARAVDAAVAIKRQLLQHKWTLPITARVGLHTGNAEPEDGDYH